MTLPFPFGLSLAVPPIPTPPDRREYVDPSNQIQSARLIDPSTRDFVIAPNGHFVGEDAIKQRVYLSLLTHFNSSAQAGVGNQFYNIKLITPNVANMCKAAVKLALSNLTNSGEITLNGVDVMLNGPGVVILQVRWSDNAGTPSTTNLPVKAL